MARWRLKDKHYIQLVNSAIWERREVSRETGKEGISRHKVPTFLDPDIPSDCNYRNHEEYGDCIIVCWEGKGKPRDLEFVGAPTPDMEPIDAEAEEISAPIIEAWKRSHPIESLGGTYSDAVIQDLNRKIDVMAATQAVGAAGGVTQEQFNKLMAKVEELSAENAKLRSGRRL